MTDIAPHASTRDANSARSRRYAARERRSSSLGGQHRLHAAVLAGASLVVLALPSLTHAQAQAQAAPQPPGGGGSGQTEAPSTTSVGASAGSSNQIAEVVVTAQRRSENLERTPVAVSVLSADALAKQDVTTQADLQITVPGLLVRQSSNSNDLNFAIRGQSRDAFSATRPGVLPYLNEVQVGGLSSTSIYDLQSVQVLKGPQGTLFGRSATGGAVLYTTAKPTTDFGGFVSAGGGNYDTGQFEGALNVPLIDERLLSRLSAFGQTNSGYQENLYNGKDLGGADRYGLRLSLEGRINDRLRDELVVDYYHARGRSVIGVLSSLNPNSGLPVTSLYTNATFPAGSGPLTDTSVSDYVLSQILQAQGVPAAVAGALSAGNYARYIASLNSPYAPAGGVAAVLAAQQARGPYEATAESPGNFRTQNLVVTNSTTFDLTPDLQVKNIFGLTNLRLFDSTDLDGTPFSIIDNGTSSTTGTTNSTNQVSDELQLIGKALDKNLQYVAGFYYQQENEFIAQHSDFVDILLGGQQQQSNSQRSNKTYAAYAQGTYDLESLTGLHGLSATAGVRYTNETVGNLILPGDSTFGLALAQPSVYSNDQSRTFDNVGWTLGLQEQLSPSTLIYVASRRSFKNGGFNGIIAPKIGFSEVAGNAYRTETVTDVELGSKFQGRIAGMPVRLNGDVYYDWIDNSQRTSFITTGGNLAAITVNVPESKVYGSEVDGQVNPLPWLSVGGALNYTFARFTDNLTSVAGTTQPFETYPDTPRWSGVVYAEATRDLTPRLTGLLHADVFAQSRTYFSSTGNLDPGAFNVGYGLLNVHASLQDKQSGWQLIGTVKNLLDKTYYVGGLAVGQLIGVNTRIPGEPRTFLIQVRKDF